MYYYGMGFSQVFGMLLVLFKHWAVSPAEQLALLGLPAGDMHSLGCLQRGEPIATDADTLTRAGDPLGIHAALRSLFPKNPHLAYTWVRRPNLAFYNRAPMEVMLGGMPGLVQVRQYLEDQCWG